MSKIDINTLESEIKKLIITSLELEDISVEDINSEDPLFVDGLGLDSIDALELGMALKKKYGLTLTSENNNKQHFYSVKTLAALVASQIK